MIRSTNTLLSVSQVLAIEPADDSWVDGGFTGVVHSIKPPQANARKKFWKCLMADETSKATIGMTIFFAPKFNEGDTLEVTGQGIKRKEFNGAAEVGVGQKTEIRVVLPDQTKAKAPESSPRNATPPPTTRAAPATAPAVPLSSVHMAMHESLALVSRGLDRPQLLEVMTTKLFWTQVHSAASSILRLTDYLEKGKLAPSAKDRGKTNGSS